MDRQVALRYGWQKKPFALHGKDLDGIFEASVMRMCIKNAQLAWCAQKAGKQESLSCLVWAWQCPSKTIRWHKEKAGQGSSDA